MAERVPSISHSNITFPSRPSCRVSLVLTAGGQSCFRTLEAYGYVRRDRFILLGDVGGFVSGNLPATFSVRIAPRLRHKSAETGGFSMAQCPRQRSGSNYRLSGALRRA